MTPQDMQKEIERLQKANAELQAKATKAQRLTCKVSEKGALSVYGLGRWPVTLYKTQWERLLGFAPEIKAFAVANDSKLTTKE